jgi:hypothetical protein
MDEAEHWIIKNLNGRHKQIDTPSRNLDLGIDWL